MPSIPLTISGEELKSLDFTEVRGMEGIKEASYKVGDLEVKVAVASSLGCARKLLDKIRAGEATYHFVEIMACPGGCINGGGQPFLHGDTALLEKRMKGLYAEDAGKTLRLSHENPDIQKLYNEYLGTPGSEKAHHLLHTKYTSK